MSDDDRIEVAELVEALIDIVAQSCTVDGRLDSCCTSTYARALRLLARIGVVTITREYGRCVIAQWAVKS